MLALHDTGEGSKKPLRMLTNYRSRTCFHAMPCANTREQLLRSDTNKLFLPTNIDCGTIPAMCDDHCSHIVLVPFDLPPHIDRSPFTISSVSIRKNTCQQSTSQPVTSVHGLEGTSSSPQPRIRRPNSGELLGNSSDASSPLCFSTSSDQGNLYPRPVTQWAGEYPDELMRAFFAQLTMEARLRSSTKPRAPTSSITFLAATQIPPTRQVRFAPRLRLL